MNQGRVIHMCDVCKSPSPPLTSGITNHKCFNHDRSRSLSETQSCTEMIMPMCTNGGADDVFEPYPWDFEAYADYCENKYGVRPTTDLVEKQYGGKDLRAASNIVFR